ncbi:MAG: UDP-N-acetylmuramate--L-alanine ligase [Bacteroidaceae bacterium]|nr:UDP-N-acetylmuramate--L-alanine ligase [Bacteroidaceae bacterium]
MNFVKGNKIESVYFVGAGGIGMSALLRYFLSEGYNVGGYDKTPTQLTNKLMEEGAQIHFEESVALIPDCFKEKDSTLVVFTPAIPEDHEELVYFREKGFDIRKRAEVLGLLTDSHKGICVAGTHGKTTTSTMVAHLLNQSHLKCNAFLGGISKNYGTNYLLSEKREYVVIEADEFDRSFHWLNPYMSVITSTDPDHLDIYGTKEAYLESFRKYSSLIRPGGALIVHKGLEMTVDVQKGVKVYEYSRTEGDYHASEIRIGNGEIIFDFVYPSGVVENVKLGVPVSINIDNAVAAMALAQLCGATDEELRAGMDSFRGVDRRFDFKIKNDRIVFLSDYAHHPHEIEQSIKSVKELYEGKKIAAIFQPHLYTRTRDFYKEFAKSLSLLDVVYLLDIYPAREEPIPGVSSEIIYDNLRADMEKHLISKSDVEKCVAEGDFDVLLSLGAGDIENYVPKIVDILSKR